MQALSKKKTGDICTIKWMFGIPDVLDFLRSRNQRRQHRTGHPENKRWIDPWHGWKTDCNV